MNIILNCSEKLKIDSIDFDYECNFDINYTEAKVFLINFYKGKQVEINFL